MFRVWGLRAFGLLGFEGFGFRVLGSFALWGWFLGFGGKGPRVQGLGLRPGFEERSHGALGLFFLGFRV